MGWILLLLYLTVCTLDAFTPSHARRVIRAVPGASTTGGYIVKLSDSVTHDQFEAAVQQATSLAKEINIYERVEGDVAKIFAMKLSHAEAEKVSRMCFIQFKVAVELYIRFIIDRPRLAVYTSVYCIITMYCSGACYAGADNELGFASKVSLL